MTLLIALRLLVIITVLGTYGMETRKAYDDAYGVTLNGCSNDESSSLCFSFKKLFHTKPSSPHKTCFFVHVTWLFEKRR